MNTETIEARKAYLEAVATAVRTVESDPRAPNCRAFLLDSRGRVVGINLVHVPIPSAKYELALAELIDEVSAQGNTVVTVTVLNAAGIQTAERCLMAWPFPGLDGEDSPAGPGNPQNQFATTSKYSSAIIGPLAFYVGDNKGNPISDIIGGYGLPDGRHISGRVTFQEREADTGGDDDGGDDGEEPVGDDLAALIVEVARIGDALEALAGHLGA